MQENAEIDQFIEYRKTMISALKKFLADHEGRLVAHHIEYYKYVEKLFKDIPDGVKPNIYLHMEYISEAGELIDQALLKEEYHEE